MKNSGKTEGSHDAPARQRVPVGELFFDTLNPRLAELGLGKHPTQREILEAL
ncbi:MAG TPA: hypothetical protein VMF69_12765 [Gemmataceae bacterium]|nr:hypothetical protein [Gemmataceae bacterium]